MKKYLINRILRGLFSVIMVVGIVMLMIYSALDRNLIFSKDANYSHIRGNAKEVYMQQQWERYGYVDYVPYTEWLRSLMFHDEITQQEYDAAVKIGNKASNDSDATAKMVERFTQEMEEDGFKVVRLDAKIKKGTKKYQDGGEPRLYATKDIPLIMRLVKYIGGLISVDNVHDVEEDIENRGLEFTLHDPVYGGKKFSPAIMGNGTNHKYLLYFDNQFPFMEEDIENRGLEFTLHDPVYGGKKFSPAIMGNGTNHKYLLYFDNQFPFIHQNLVNVNLGKSYSIRQGVDVFQIMTEAQGSFKNSLVECESG